MNKRNPLAEKTIQFLLDVAAAASEETKANREGTVYFPFEDVVSLLREYGITYPSPKLPWRLSDVEWQDGAHVGYRYVPVVTDAGDVVAKVQVDEDDPEQERNLRMIRRAPELLKAVREFRTLMLLHSGKAEAYGRDRVPVLRESAIAALALANQDSVQRLLDEIEGAQDGRET